MADTTSYAVLPFSRIENGDLVAEEGFEAASASLAVAMARAFANKQAGAIAFSRTANPETGEFAAVVLGRFGETLMAVELLVGPSAL
jgi:hypothetical protein